MRGSNVVVTDPVVAIVPGKTIPDDEKEHKVLELIQLSDVLMGAASQLLDATSKETGCCQVAEAFQARVEKMCQNPFNKNSSTWRRLAMRFFPKHQVILDSDGNVTAESADIYPTRPVRYVNKDQLDFFDDLMG